MKHISFDIETWGKRTGCDLRSIGAVVFDPVAGWVHGGLDGQFYVATDNPVEGIGSNNRYEANGYRKYPLIREYETVNWWNDQAPKAQAAFDNPVDLHEALRLFGKWLRDVTGDYYDIGDHDRKFPDNVRLWANHSHFDAPILDAAFQAVGLPTPWHYRAPKDMPTITEAAGMTHDDFCNHGVAHHALDDAIAQAMTVCEAYKRLGLRRS